MTPDNYLFFFVVGVLVVTVYLLCTSEVTAEERDAMLKDGEMWP